MNRVPNTAAKTAGGMPTPTPTPTILETTFGPSLKHVEELAVASLVFEGAELAVEDAVEAVDVGARAYQRLGISKIHIKH